MLNIPEKTLCIGTMLKLETPDFVEYADFMASAGMECCQLCRLNERFMDGGAENAETKKLLEGLERRGIPPVSIFLFYKNRAAGNGLVSPELRAERFAFAFRQMLWGGRLGVKYISCHAGVFPETNTKEFEDFAKDMKFLAQFAADLGQYFLFETGPETADALCEIIERIGEPNVGINFDPANLLLYDRTPPAIFAEKLCPKIKLIHCKDGKRPADGEKTGVQMPLGKGDANFFELLVSIIEKGFRGPLIIERETPHDEKHFEDQREAVSRLSEIRKKFM